MLICGSEFLPGGLGSLFLGKLIDVNLSCWITHVDPHLEQMPQLVELAELPFGQGSVLSMPNPSRGLDEVMEVSEQE
jgi:hypothetical protein